VHWDRVTNGPRTLFGVDFYTTLWVSAIFGMLTIVVAYWFKESNLGLKLRASRDDHFAASSIGINLVNVRWAAFTLSAFVAAFGGGLWAHYITSFSPSAFYLTETFVILAMLVVGGPNGVSGAVIGTVVVTAVREGLRAIENNVNIAQLFPEALVGFTEVLLAVFLILILIFRPQGILGGRELRWPGMRRVFRPVAAQEPISTKETRKERIQES
jgi:branched-chain amino acid transport system permease protein